MTEELGIGLATAALMSMAFRGRAEKQRRADDPEYAAEMKAKEERKAENQFKMIYAQALADNEECDRCPRAFKRRINQSKAQS